MHPEFHFVESPGERRSFLSVRPAGGQLAELKTKRRYAYETLRREFCSCVPEDC
jgi:hypothetical protein